MTIIEARNALEGPLRFGEDEQIKAVDFVCLVESCATAILGCNAAIAIPTIARPAMARGKEREPATTV